MFKSTKHIIRLLRAILKALLELNHKSDEEIIATLDSTDRPPDPPING